MDMVNVSLLAMNKLRFRLSTVQMLIDFIKHFMKSFTIHKVKIIVLLVSNF